MNTISRNEAQSTLETIEQIQRQTRRALAHGGGPFYMMLWGAIWFLGYLANQFLSEQLAGYIWMFLVSLGMIASIAIGWRHARRLRHPTHDARIGLFWLAWIIYSSLIIWLTGAQTDATLLSLIIALFAMFGYVVMGLWLWRPLAWIGIAVTVIAVGAYLLLPDYVDLVMALLGGGTLFVSGLYIYRSWR